MAGVAKTRINTSFIHRPHLSSSHRSRSHNIFFDRRKLLLSPRLISTSLISTNALRPTKRLLSSHCQAAAISSMSTDKRKVEIFESEEELAPAIAKYIAELSEKFCKERGNFTVVLSGGSLIKSLRKLVEPPYLDSIDWEKWHVFWVDERVVPKDHVDSNYKLAYEGLLSQIPIPPGHVYAINDALSAEAAAEDYEVCLKHLVHNRILATSSNGFPKFDLMLLGMGPDGHVASLFPGHPLCNEKKKWVTFIKDSPKPPPNRITFTFPVINSAAYNAIVICGAGKAGPVQAALGNSQNADPLPVQMVSAEEQFTWFLDKAAASKL